uniref:DsbC domain-containing protein n=1 Tax=Panagrellus redivivus TaxID=6233 RepID=A0A7E4VSR1_PANRE
MEGEELKKALHDSCQCQMTPGTMPKDPVTKINITLKDPSLIKDPVTGEPWIPTIDAATGANNFTPQPTYLPFNAKYGKSDKKGE